MICNTEKANTSRKHCMKARCTVNNYVYIQQKTTSIYSLLILYSFKHTSKAPCTLQMDLNTPALCRISPSLSPLNVKGQDVLCLFYKWGNGNVHDATTDWRSYKDHCDFVSLFPVVSSQPQLLGYLNWLGTGKKEKRSNNAPVTLAITCQLGVVQHDQEQLLPFTPTT